MRITHGTNLLADDAQLLYARDLRSEAQLQTQTFRGLRAATARYFARGNKLGRITLRVTRRHASLADAEDYLLTHGQEVCGQATATIVCGEPGDTTTLTLPGATLEVVDSTQAGLSTTHDYALTGGPIIAA